MERSSNGDSLGDNFNKKLKTGKTEEDWISRVPNEVICRILSFLRTKDAIATSALAKRAGDTFGGHLTVANSKMIVYKFFLIKLVQKVDSLILLMGF